MGRYGKELGAVHADPAGKYLDAARQRRKGDHVAVQRAASDALIGDSEWKNIDLVSVAAEVGGSLEEVARQLFLELPVGGCVACKNLDKRQRALVHDLAHRLSGLWKNSCRDPDGGDGSRMVCIRRIEETRQVTQNSTSASSNCTIAPSAAVASARTCLSSNLEASVDVLSQEAQPPIRRNRWRRDKSKKETEEQTQSVAGAELSSQISRGESPALQHEVRSSPKKAESASTCVEGSVCIVWLRDDMRLADNPALYRAAMSGFDWVVPVFIWDEEAWKRQPLRGAGRIWKHESLRVFSSSLSSLGSRLAIRNATTGDVAGELLAIVDELFQSSHGSHVSENARSVLIVFNRRYDPEHVARDQKTVSTLEGAGLTVESFPGNVLYEPQELQPIERWQRWRAKVRAEESTARGLNDESATCKPKQLEHISGFGSYRFFSHALEELGMPQRPCATVQRLPRFPCGVSSCALDSLGLGKSTGCGFPSDFRQYSTSSEIGTGGTWSSSDWSRELRKSWMFGEQAALERLEDFLDNVLAPGDFEGRKRLLCNQRNTSELSPYIRFGEISVRTIYWGAKQRKNRTNQKLFEDTGYVYVSRHGSTYKGDTNSKPLANATFLRRFVWRDLAYWFLWEFPDLPTKCLRPQYEKQVWSGTQAQLRLWQRGRTGFPLVDAAMRQLWAIGWMPNYLRHLVAQTLIEYLDIDWRHGLEWFDYTLVDMDVAINSFMWQNGGHSGADHWEFVLHPVNAAKTCDPDGTYVRRWLPFLAECPTEYIHRPWDLPARIFRWPAGSAYPSKPLISDLDEARRVHLRHVLDVRKMHPEMVSRTGHEWLKLPGRGGLLAKCVTRLEFRAETEDFLLYQGPERRKKNAGKNAQSASCGANHRILSEMMGRDESENCYGAGF